jgi:AcrR family transcriptional regulator
VRAKSGDRSHIIEAFVSMVAERGYAQTKVSEVTVRADVTRAHFYELFRDREDCFLQAQRELTAAMVDDARQAIAAANPGAAVQAALAALTDFADQRVAAFTFITHEATLAGPRAWQQRERMIAAIGAEIERRWESLPPKTPVPDLDPSYLLGGAVRALGMRMRRDEDPPKSLLGELVSWAESY